LHKGSVYLRVSVIPLIVLALFGLLFTGAVPTEDDTVFITIVHTNDVHGRVWAEEGGAMGYTHMAAIVKELREAGENVLLLDAGDTFQGSSAASLSQGESIVKIMNSMGYDAMVAGNHDFAYGWQKLCELSEMANFPVLSANVVGQDGRELLQPATIKELGGVRIGIFGLTTPETVYKTHPRNVGGLLFTDPVQRAREMVPHWALSVTC
jgi:2',3'-cyclic-nucleotide 2'-phosphodiesterase (5'-nucleotidase family)